ncbi:hypothetical protein GCM10027341_50450 [Spirosoma knui]
MITIRAPQGVNIEDIAEKHYDCLEQTLLKRISRKRTDTPDDSQKQFLKDNLYEILTAHPKRLQELQEEAFDEYDFKEPTEDFPVALVSIFNYQDFTKKKVDEYDAYDLSESLGINVCPYCNLNFTHTVKQGDVKIARPDFDHFFPKSKFPLLSLSFYNLIPCCGICNSNIKKDKVLSLEEDWHPYLDLIANKMIIDYEPRTLPAIYGLDGKNLKIKIYPKPDTSDDIKTKIKNTVNMFKLEERYDLHADYASEILLKQYHTSGSYLQSLKDAFVSAGFTEAELHRIAFANYHETDGFDKRPLSKLTFDFVKKQDWGEIKYE